MMRFSLFKQIFIIAGFLLFGITLTTLISPIVEVPAELLYCGLLAAIILYFYYGPNLSQRTWLWLNDENFLRKVTFYLAFLYLIFFVYSLFVLPTTQASEFSVHFISLAWLQGKPMYHPLDSQDQYSLLYGPLTFLIYAGSYTLFGINLYSPKLLSFFLFGLACFSMWQVLKKNPLKKKLILLLIALSYLCLFRVFTFTPKPDPALLVCTALSVLIISRPIHWIAQCAVVGVLMGIAINLKITACLYFLPILFLLCENETRGKQALEIITILLLASLTFCIAFTLPDISFENYRNFVLLSTQHPWLFPIFIGNLIALIPAITIGFFIKKDKSELWRWWVLLISAISLAIPAAKQGSGYYHCAPFLPIFIYLLAKSNFTSKISSVTKKAVLGTILFTWLFFILPLSLIINAGVSTYRQQHFFDLKKELHQFKKDFPGQTFGVLNHFFLEPIVYLNGGTLQYSFWSMMDYRLAGLVTPIQVTNSLAQCKVKYWLVKKDMEPLRGPAGLEKRIYDENFRKIFFNHYKKIREGKHLDIFACSDSK